MKQQASACDRPKARTRSESSSLGPRLDPLPEMGALKRITTCTRDFDLLVRSSQRVREACFSLQSLAAESGQCCCEVAIDMLGAEIFSCIQLCRCVCACVCPTMHGVCVRVYSCVCACALDSVCRLSQLLRRVPPLVRWWPVCSWVKVRLCLSLFFPGAF